MEPARLTPATRRTLRLAGLGLIVLGAAVVVLGVIRMFGALGPSSDFEESSRSSLAGFGTAAGGMLLLSVGATMVRFGFLKPLAEIVATETGAAVEHTARHAGRGLSTGFAEPGPLDGLGIRVRCRACGFLDSEDARFCSGCGQAI